jgi:hypothetical protein
MSPPSRFSFPPVACFFFAATLFLPGCLTMRPEKMSSEEVARRNAATLALLEAEKEPLPAELTLGWAYARALQHNLDRQVKVMETAIAFGQFDLAKLDTLPKLTAEAGYYNRDNESIVRSRDSVTGQPSLAHPSISSDRNHVASSVGPTWSLLDFGSSYYSAKQAGDRALSAVERRRKSTHLLLAEVRSAFWRVAVAQRLEPEVTETLRAAEAALAEARRLEQERLRPPTESLRLQKALLDNIRQLEALRQDMQAARIELAHLLAAPADARFAVREPSFTLPPGLVDVPAADLETAALAHNPDVAVALYDARIAQLDARKAIVKLFPSVTFDYELRHDTDNYMINNSWNTASARISFDLFRLASLGRDLDSIELTEQLAQRKQMAVLMAVVAQVHLARLEYHTALHAYGRADDLAQVDGRLRDIAVLQGKAEAQSKLDVVSARTSAIVSVGHRYQAIVQAQAAIGRLQSTLGVDPVSETALDLPTDQLAQRLEAYLAGWQDGSWLKNLNNQPR